MYERDQSGALVQVEPGLGELVTQLNEDMCSITRKYSLCRSCRRRQSVKHALKQWAETIKAVPQEGLTQTGKVDIFLLAHHVNSQLVRYPQLEEEDRKINEALPFAELIVSLIEECGPGDKMMASEVATKLDQAQTLLTKTQESEPKLNASEIEWAEELSTALATWGAQVLPYDPEVGWWAKAPFESLQTNLTEFVTKLKADPASKLIDPIGRERLQTDLDLDLVSYTPEQLFAIGEREYDWCLNELVKASEELGFGANWKDAMESVKVAAVPPGEQAVVVRDLAEEAIHFLESKDLMTLPELAKQTWRMEMMPAEAQKVNPFFLGGEAIIVSYPTQEMGHRDKLMSMRGNNAGFSRATVQHELIPGHHMQQFMCARHRPYRELFSTPFWIEGWTLYWELLLWELGFPKTPQHRIGMLFWRMHRCVRIVFSLGYHLGQFTAEECVDMLVERVGHERANAEAEVRRSFGGLYPPLYQAAYMLGGLQFRAMSREAVKRGESLKQFHDKVMRQNEMPPVVLRELLEGRTHAAGTKLEWLFDSPQNT